MDRISSPSKNEESFLPLDRLVEVYLRSNRSIYKMKFIRLQIMDDIKYVSISWVISENLIVLNRSGKHLLTSLVDIVFSLSYSTTSYSPSFWGFDVDLLLLIRLYAYLALLPIEQIQCNKSLWITWIEIGHAVINCKMSRLLRDIYLWKKGSFWDLGLILPFAV